jgi:hypothetical protein
MTARFRAHDAAPRWPKSSLYTSSNAPIRAVPCRQRNPRRIALLGRPYGTNAIKAAAVTQGKISYEVGLARYAGLTKGQMLGDEQGLLKLLFDPENLKLLGVHVIGDRAAEIVHIGQAVLTMGGTLEYFRDTVFNYPTLAEAYKVAALDGLNKV